MTRAMRSTDLTEALVDRATLLAAIEAQCCPWCGRDGLRSLANHTVLAHQIYAHELRELAGLAPDAPLCAPALSECHRELAREQDTHQWLQRPEVLKLAAATREANYDDEQRKRRVEHLAAVRPKAVEAFRRKLRSERNDPELAAARRVARSEVGRSLRAGRECVICGAWFCSVAPVGQDCRQRKTCSEACHSEALRRIRRRAWMRRSLESLGISEPVET